MITVSIDKTGPFFDEPLRKQVFDDIELEVVRGLAFAGMNLVRANTHRFKNPTGFWKSRIDSVETAAYTDVINPTVYTPWLEGVSARNRSSSFKGYKLFEQAEVELAKIAQQLADQIVGEEIGRLQ